MSNTVAVIVLLVASVACITDIRSRRIPNVLTFGAALAAIAFHTYGTGWAGLQTAGLGWLAGAALFLPMFLLGGMGAGDVKLLAALGAWLGPRDTLWLAVYSCIAGGILGIVVALARGYLGTAINNVRTLVTYWFISGIRPLPSLTLEHGQGPRLAYAVPMLAGTVVTLWIR